MPYLKFYVGCQMLFIVLSKQAYYTGDLITVQWLFILRASAEEQDGNDLSRKKLAHPTIKEFQTDLYTCSFQILYGL